ncbi:MAG: hypothetical protein E7483_04520 [Ruminococcaceae bacterium]|nr:hypothetical protein [Oscillospiraceae bacterium]
MKKFIATAVRIVVISAAVIAVCSIMSAYLNNNMADRKLGILCYEDCDVDKIDVEYNGRTKTLRKGLMSNWFKAMPLKSEKSDVEYTVIVAKGTPQEYRYVLKVPADTQWKEANAILRRYGSSYTLTDWEYY